MASICPKCGKTPEEELWVYNEKLFCSEKCVREYAGGRP